MKDILRTIGERKHLTRTQAAEAMRTIMEGNATDAQIGALLMGLRIKVEQPEELLGFVETMREKSVKIRVADPDAIDMCGTGGDGSNTFNISTVAAFVVAGAGITVAKHGNRAISSTCGSADVLQALGVDVTLPPEETERQINTLGIGFLFAPLFHPAMKHVARARTDLAMKTCFNLLGPMTNPAGVRRQVVGTYSHAAAALIANVLHAIGIRHAIVLTSEDGMDEVSLSSPTIVYHVRPGDPPRPETVRPSDFPLGTSTALDLRGGTPQENAAIATAVLSGRKGPQRDIVVANAAFGILASDRATSIHEAVALAEESIDSGKALSKLRQLAGAGRR